MQILCQYHKRPSVISSVSAQRLHTCAHIHSTTRRNAHHSRLLSCLRIHSHDAKDDLLLFISPKSSPQRSAAQCTHAHITFTGHRTSVQCWFSACVLTSFTFRCRPSDADLDAEVFVVHGGELVLRGDHALGEPARMQRLLRARRPLQPRELDVHEALAVLVHVHVAHRPVAPALVLDVLGDVLAPLGLRLRRGVEHVLEKQALRGDGRPWPQHPLHDGLARQRQLRGAGRRQRLGADEPASHGIHAPMQRHVDVLPGQARHERRPPARVHAQPLTLVVDAVLLLRRRRRVHRCHARGSSTVPLRRRGSCPRSPLHATGRQPGMHARAGHGHRHAGPPGAGGQRRHEHP
mmetsp:Transcript_15543/g.37641  ORF Transcript_15543/g.37641 Transcript_15543/m.37641 type:complete len:349 (-) Transcript_15543:775-1821(-)